MDELEQLREAHQRHMNRNLELLFQLDEAREHTRILREALRSLANEVAGCFGIAQQAIQDAVGYTNYQCLLRRRMDADELLAATPSEAVAKSAARIAELEAQLAFLLARQAGRWNPIETAPKDGTNVMLYAPAAVYQGKPVQARLTYGHWDTPEHGKYLGDCGGECRCPVYDEPPPPYWYSDDGGFTEEYPPTQWMPRPAPPVDEEVKSK